MHIHVLRLFTPGQIAGVYISGDLYFTNHIDFGGPGRGVSWGFNLPENGALQVLGLSKCLKMDIYIMKLHVRNSERGGGGLIGLYILLLFAAVKCNIDLLFSINFFRHFIVYGINCI